MAKLLPPESAALEVVAREVGIGAGTLEGWRDDAQSMPAQGRAWTAGARLSGFPSYLKRATAWTTVAVRTFTA